MQSILLISLDCFPWERHKLKLAPAMPDQSYAYLNALSPKKSRRSSNVMSSYVQILQIKMRFVSSFSLLFDFFSPFGC
jgi:hypothetical protein